MRILYVAPKYDYGDARRGCSFEHYNFYDCMLHMGHELIHYDFMTELQPRGKVAMNVGLLDLARSERADLLFCVLADDQISMETLRTITRETDKVAFNWFCDDNWRFDGFSRHWAPAFSWVGTTYQTALEKYARFGIKNVIKTQWGCNHFLYQQMNLPLEYDVTFIGQPHGRRRQLIGLLREAGVNVRTWSHGWPSGRLTQEHMIETLNKSRINLNFTQSFATGTRWKNITNRVFRMDRGVTTQIKARTFEVPGCGACMLTEMADHLADYYVPGDEIAVFSSANDLVEKVKYYLAHEDERGAVAQAGHRRTLMDHALEKRLNDIFSLIGLPTAAQLPNDGNLERLPMRDQPPRTFLS